MTDLYNEEPVEDTSGIARREDFMSTTRKQAVDEILTKVKEVLLSTDHHILLKFFDENVFGGSKKEKTLIAILIREPYEKDKFEDIVERYGGSCPHLNVEFYDGEEE